MSASTHSPLILAHRLWRLLPATARRQALARVTGFLAPRPQVSPPWARQGVVIAGYLSDITGLGEAARLMIRACRAMGVPVWAVDLPDPTAGRTTSHDGFPGPPPPKGAPLILHVNAPLLPLTLLRLPKALTRDRRIIAHWSWELPDMPPEWKVAAPLVHEVWVPSRFTAQAVEALKPHRVHVVPPALALAPPKPSALTRADFGLPPDAVVVLFSFNLASSFARKNPLGAIAAFRTAFGDRTDRVLVIKVCHTDHGPEDFARLRNAAAAPNIRLITGQMSPADRHALTAQADIALTLHRSEGFGLFPAEAMMLSKPVVATGWSGNMDFMDATNSGLVGYRLVTATDPRAVYRDSVWAEPNCDHAAVWLRRLADDQAFRHALGEQARRAITRTLGGGALRTALRATGLPVAPILITPERVKPASVAPHPTASLLVAPLPVAGQQIRPEATIGVPALPVGTPFAETVP